DLRELAAPAPPPELRLAEIVEDRGAAPEIREGPLPKVAGGDGHVGARRHVALGRDAAVILTRRARAVRVVPEQRRRGIELPEDPPEVGRALGADQKAVGAADRRRPWILEGVRGARRGGGATEQPLDERRR